MLTIHTNIFSPMSVQIVEEYQNAIEWVNREEYREDNKKGLDEITNYIVVLSCI